MAGGQSPPPLPTSGFTNSAEVKRNNTQGVRVPKIVGYPTPKTHIIQKLKLDGRALIK